MASSSGKTKASSANPGSPQKQLRNPQSSRDQASVAKTSGKFLVNQPMQPLQLPRVSFQDTFLGQVLLLKGKYCLERVELLS